MGQQVGKDNIKLPWQEQINCKNGGRQHPNQVRPTGLFLIV